MTNQYLLNNALYGIYAFIFLAFLGWLAVRIFRAKKVEQRYKVTPIQPGSIVTEEYLANN